MVEILLVVLVVTVYAGPYVGQPAFCGQTYGDGIALPVEFYGIDWE